MWAPYRRVVYFLKYECYSITLKILNLHNKSLKIFAFNMFSLKCCLYPYITCKSCPRRHLLKTVRLWLHNAVGSTENVEDKVARFWISDNDKEIHITLFIILWWRHNWGYMSFKMKTLVLYNLGKTTLKASCEIVLTRVIKLF